MRTLQMTIDKAIAKHWLSKNEKNRALSDRRVLDYLRQMNDGLWKYVGDPIRFVGEYERLIDGQHRLSAFVKSNLEDLDVLVITGLTDDAFHVIDRGGTRSIGDSVKICGYSNSTDLATTAKAVYNAKNNQVSFIRNGNVKSLNGKARVTTQEVLEFIEANPYLQTCVAFAQKWHSRFKGLNRNEYSTYYFLFAEKDKTAAYEFMEQLSSGLNLTENSPIYQLRKKLEQDRMSTAKLVGKMRQVIIITCWNAYRRGMEMKMIRVNYENDVPAII